MGKKCKALKKSNKEFTSKTRLFDLVRKEHHSDLQLLVRVLRPWLIEGMDVDWKNLRRLEVDYSKISKDYFFLVITNFLNRIGGGDGLNRNMETFIRYLASTEHSNFGYKESSLKSKIYSMLRYHKDRQNEL